ncbi:MAG: hypothetical protein O3A19_03115 [Planctomycetota bacterium]|nr:hypothetical protein [Planctomycetota bacterium]MDA1025398.1 hypothetical protein [Planctomycetota bacterium]
MVPPDPIPMRDDHALEAALFDAVAENAISERDMKDLLHRMKSAPRAPRRDAVRCEIEVALRFIEAGSRVRAEVTGPHGRSVDLEVHTRDCIFAVHVKRLQVSPLPLGPLPIGFDGLASIPRPYLVGVEWLGSGEPEGHVLAAAREFLLGARIGDRLVLRNTASRRIGAIEIAAPRPPDPEGTPSIKIVAAGNANHAKALVRRAGRLLRRAYRQFVPDRENVIVLAGGGPSARDVVDRAVLGGHVERWDQFPPRHQRVAHGRNEEGLWQERRFERSHLVAWCPLAIPQGAIWIRESGVIPPAVIDTARRAVGAAPGPDAPSRITS